MPPHRNVPGNTPSMKPVKPERTLRSHEENQERAYIAASRRSDRSLEARVESARRASDIHKKRTGRALRVTEQDVMNEEMYEEEDDDMPWRYRSITSHLPLEDGTLSRRIQSMLAVQLENQRLLGQAVNSTLQHNPQIQKEAQFISPGMMQMPQGGGYGNSMLPPQQQYNRNHHRQSPYPLPNDQQQMRQNGHQRSASFAGSQDVSGIQQQYQQSNSSTPVPSASPDNRRASLPQNMMPQMSRPSTSHEESAPTTPSYLQPNSQQQKSHQRAASYAGPFDQTPRPADPAQALTPLTTTLPMETQQILAGAENYPSFDMMMQQGDDVDDIGLAKHSNPQQNFYSYKPNANNYGSGLDQTLLPTNNVDTPTTGSSLNSAITDAGYGFGFDGGDGQDGFGEPLFNDFLEQDMFGSQFSPSGSVPG